MSYKKNILILGIPIYAALDFYSDKINKYGKDYNFYLLLDNRGLSKNILDQLDILKNKNLIKDFFILPMVDDDIIYKKFNLLSLYKVSKTILNKINKIKYDLIISSTNIETSSNYIIQKLKKKYKSTLIGLPVHNFKVSNELIENWDKKFQLKNLIKIRTNFKVFRKFINLVIMNIISLFIFKDFIILKNNNDNYPIYTKNLDYFISPKQSEVFLYSRKFKDLKTFHLKNEHYCKCEIKKKNNLLVIPKLYFKNKKIMDILVSEYVENILKLVKIYNFEQIDIKPHPRDHTDNSLRIKTNLLKYNLKVDILDKNSQFINYCEYLAIMGVASTMLVNAIDKCNKILSFGMLKLGEWTHKNPTPKYLVGEYEGFKSGIIWIDEFKYFEKLDKKDLILSFKKLKKERFRQNINSITFEELINL